MKYKALLIIFLSLFIFSGVCADLTVKFLDVGQGDAILLESNGQHMLIDAGPASANVMQHLRGIPQIDYLIATHPHEDHIGGMVSVINSIPVKKYIDNGAIHTSKTYENLMSALVNKQIPYAEAKKGDSFTLGNTRVEVTSPQLLTGDLNDDSVTLLVIDGSIRYLFTGDNEHASSPATILKVAHHGSSGAESKISSINPKVAVIMVGEGNSYGHPSSSVLSALNNRGIDVYRSDVHGTVTISSDGDKYSITTTKGGVGEFSFSSPTPVVTYQPVKTPTSPSTPAVTYQPTKTPTARPTIQKTPTPHTVSFDTCPPGKCWVNPYTRKDGTQVRGYCRKC